MPFITSRQTQLCVNMEGAADPILWYNYVLIEKKKPRLRAGCITNVYTNIDTSQYVFPYMWSKYKPYISAR